MTALLYISMTSGIRGPEGILTKEQADKAVELVQQLSEEWVGQKPGGLSHLHATNYVLSWNNEDSPISSVHVDAYGFTWVWTAESSDWKYYKDTVGLWGYLAPFGQAALRNWLDDHAKAMKAHEEELASLVQGLTQ